ncbi:MAG: selenium cofactor biosynthesis protein YqeC [Anaerolineales bacterium]|jgi:molybdenum cofactor cytidylyltransferase
MNLTHALRLPPIPCLALVGAGGKTTALFQLARELEPPVIVTATTHLASSQTPLAHQHIIIQSLSDLDAFEQAIPDGVTLITGPLEGDRTSGLSNEQVVRLHEICQERSLPLLIEADGSRSKPLKAPSDHEPPIPDFVKIVVVVAGVSALGQPLNERTVHRVELFSRLSGLAPGELITGEALLRVLVHPRGGLKNIPATARRIVLLNQADTDELQAQARYVSEKLLTIYYSVVVASLQQEVIHAVFEPVAGILLAAGESRRFGQVKQLLAWQGQPFVHVVAETALKAGLSPVIVVSGASADDVRSALRDLPVVIVHNDHYQEGQSSSIRCGLQRIPTETGAVIFLLADQPQVSSTVLRALAERHSTDLPPVLAPFVEDRRANPVLFDRVTFPDLELLQGDVGGRAIFNKYPVSYLPWHDPSLLLDIDTPEDLAKLKAGNR